MDVSLVKTNNYTADLKGLKKQKKSEEPQEPQDKHDKSDLSFKDKLKDDLGKVKDWIGKHIIGDKADFETKKKMNKIMTLGFAGGGPIGAAVGFVLGYLNQKDDKVTEQWNTHKISDPSMDGWTNHDTEYGHTEYYTYYYYESVSHSSTDSDGHTYTYYTYEQRSRTDSRYEHDGYRHSSDPNVVWTDLKKTFQTPELVHDKKIGPLEGTALGFLGGTVIGGVISVIGAHIFKLAKQAEEAKPDANK